MPFSLKDIDTQWRDPQWVSFLLSGPLQMRHKMNQTFSTWQPFSPQIWFTVCFIPSIILIFHFYELSTFSSKTNIQQTYFFVQTTLAQTKHLKPKQTVIKQIGLDLPFVIQTLKRKSSHWQCDLKLKTTNNSLHLTFLMKFVQTFYRCPYGFKKDHPKLTNMLTNNKQWINPC